MPTIITISKTSKNPFKVKGKNQFRVSPTPSNLITPSLPRIFIDTTFSLPTGGTTWNVSTTAQMNTALASAVGGDVIVITNGSNLQGPFNLRARGDTQFLYIVDSRIKNGTFPRPAAIGGVTPNTSTDLANRAACRARPSDFSTPSTTSTITANSANQAITTDPGAAYYRFVGIEITNPASVTGTGVALCDIRDQTSSSSNINSQPHHIYFDRCYIHGRAGVDCRRGILANGQYVAAVDCWIEEIHCVGFESVGFASYNGAGPFKHVNCYIAAATENILYGGAQPDVNGLIPSDIETDLCHLYKDPAWIGLGYAVKDNYEHKNGSYARIQRCIFENSWQDGQTGNSILFQPLNDDGQTATWTSVTDITMSYILCKGVGSGIVLLSRVAYGTGLLPTTPMSRASFTNMLFQDVGLRTPANGFPTVNDGGRLIQVGGDLQNVVFDHITGKAPNMALIFPVSGLPNPNGLVFKRLIMGRGNFGIFGDSVSEGSIALNTYGGNYQYVQNVLYDSLASPGDNFAPSVRYTGLDPSNFFVDLGFPGSENSIQFVDPSTDQWALQATSPYHNAGSDGLDLGCDVAGLNFATANVVISR